MRTIPLMIVLMLLTQSCGSAPEELIDLQYVVERYLEATGGRENLETLRVIHTTDSITVAGLSGTTESWWVREPFSGRTTIDLGIVKQEVLMIGDSAWTVDRNGHLSVGSQEALQEAELAKKTVFYDIFLNPVDLELLPDTLIDGIAAWPVVIHGETPVTLYLSEKTWLPVLVTVTVMGMEIRQYPSDYTDINGIITAMSTRDVIPAFGQESISRNIVTEYNVPVPDSIFSIRESEMDWLLSSPGQPVPFELSDGHVYLEGDICGRTVTILLDSGAGATVVDSVLAAELGLEGTGSFVAQGLGGAQSISFVQVSEYTVAGATVSGQNLAVMPLDRPFYPATGKHIGVVLGYDFLSRFVTLLDFGRNQITLWDPDSFHYSGDQPTIPVTRTMSLLSIDAILEDSIPVTLLLDTGAGGNLHLTPTFFEDYPDFLGGRATFESVAQGVGGKEEIVAFRVSSITLGEHIVPCGIASSFGDTPILSQFHGIIGTGILARFRLYLDYDRGTIILEPSSLYEDGLPEDMTGLGYEIEGSSIVVKHVISGSAADAAGVLEGDILVRFNGTRVGADDLDELEALVPDEEGYVLELVVLRDGAEFSLDITLSRFVSAN